VAATDQRIRYYPPSIPTSPYKFVAKHQRRPAARAMTEKSRDIGATDTRELDVYQPLAGGGLGLGSFTQHNTSWSGKYQSAHLVRCEPRRLETIVSKVSLIHRCFCVVH
jgi:hypothetical protein